MKLTILPRRDLGFLAALLTLAWVLPGCGKDPALERAAAAQTEEIERLKAENQGLEQARTENEEVQKLKKENQDLPKARSHYQEAARLRKENEQLRQQVAKLTPPGSAGQAAGANAALAGGASAIAHGAHTETTATNEAVAAEGAINETDDILVDPKHLRQLLPEFDWEKLGRKEPLSIRSVLEKDGVQITNISQLREMGLTNFVIQHMPPTPPAQAQP